MKGCELCPGTARMFCESDQASLCFKCDGKVHGANFLVARHSRVLLCRTCQAPTPWKAAGPRLGPTVSFCDLCASAARGSKKNNDDDNDEHEAENAAREREDDAKADSQDGDREEDVDDEMEDEEMESDDDEAEEEEEEEGEEQVVPWSTEPPPPVASSSSSEEESMVGKRFNNNNNHGLLKRNRWGNVDLHSSSCTQDQLSCSSSPSPLPNPDRAALSNPAALTSSDDEATSDSFRPSKDRKKSDLGRSGLHQLSLISFSSGRPPI